MRVKGFRDVCIAIYLWYDGVIAEVNRKIDARRRELFAQWGRELEKDR